MRLLAITDGQLMLSCALITSLILTFVILFVGRKKKD